MGMVLGQGAAVSSHIRRFAILMCRFIPFRRSHDRPHHASNTAAHVLETSHNALSHLEKGVVESIYHTEHYALVRSVGERAKCLAETLKLLFNFCSCGTGFGNSDESGRPFEQF